MSVFLLLGDGRWKVAALARERLARGLFGEKTHEGLQSGIQPGLPLTTLDLNRPGHATTFPHANRTLGGSRGKLRAFMSMES